MAEITDQTEIRKTENFVEAEVDDELVLLHIVNGQFYALKDTGRRAWDLLDNSPRFGALLKDMLDEYEVPEDVCRAELGKLFSDLEERTLIEFG